MNPGRLNRRVTIASHGTTPDAFGQPANTWATLATVWAEITPKRGRELVAAKSVDSEVSATITIRYRADVTAAHRITHAGKIYNIAAVIDRNGEGKFLDLEVTEGLNNG